VENSFMLSGLSSTITMVARTVSVVRAAFNNYNPPTTSATPVRQNLFPAGICA
jgi:hypothetical protein